MGNTDREKLLGILADMDYNGGGMMRWHPSGEPTEQAHRVADRILAEGFAIASPESKVVREFLDTDGQGYVIERSDDGYRYVWKEAGEPDDEGIWFATEPGAIEAAWGDWETNGQGYHWAPWSKRLAKAAGYKEDK